MNKKKILMYVYGDITTDARVQRAANALSIDYDVILVSCNWGRAPMSSPYKNIFVGAACFNIKNYFVTIYETLKIIKKEKPYIFYGHDYYSAILVRLMLGRKYCKKIIYDAHELIVPQPDFPLTRRLRFFYGIERRIVKNVDLLICASEERAKIMQEHYHLDKLPVAIRNISQLVINEDEETQQILQSLDEFFAEPGITVVYAGVVIESRRIDKLVEAVCMNAKKYKLLIVGKGDSLVKVRQIAKSTPDLVSAFTGAVPYRCLGAILSRCDIGFIYYPVNTLNNIFCASNKLYEYASVNLPILANNNPTIKKELEKACLGVATDDFIKGMNAISSKVAEFKQACKTYSDQNKWDDEAKSLIGLVDRINN